MSRNFLKLRLVAAGALLFAGCADPEVHTESAVIQDPVGSVTVIVGSGDVRLRGDDVAAVTVAARIQGASNHLGHALNDGELILVDDCHESHCNVDIDAVVPAGVAVELHVGSGDLRIDNLLGPILARTGSGDIQGAGVGGAALDVETGSGDVALDVGEPAERIQVRTHSGDIALGVPSGSYRLNVGTNSGDRHMTDVADDPNAAGSIDAFTGSGDVVVRGH